MRLLGPQNEEKGLKKGDYPNSRTDRDLGFLAVGRVSYLQGPRSLPPIAYVEGQ